MTFSFQPISIFQTMKIKLVYILLVSFISVTCYAQKLDRTQKPAPGPAPEIKIGNYESFELPNGLKVFVVENHKLPRVSFSLVLDLDPIMEGEKSGYISTAGELIGRGTKTRTKEQLDEEIDFIGASFNTSSSGMSGSSLKKHSEKLLEILSDVLLNPSFPATELDKIKKQTISAIAADKDDPEAIAEDVASVLVYGKDHPYGEITTEESVKKITLDDCKNFYNTYFKPNVGYLAIVGDITKKEAEPLIKKYFSSWQKAEVPKHTYKTPQQPEKRTVAIVDRPASVQSVLDITYPLELKPGSPEVIKTRLMNEITGGSFTSRLNMNLREKHGYTYGIRSAINPDKVIGKFSSSANVRNEVTDSAVFQILKELSTMEKEKVSDLELQNAKNYITGSFARSLENPQTVASFAINTAIYNLPKDYYANYLKNVQAVSIDEVQQMAQRFIKTEKAYVVVVGKADEIAKGLASFGEIRYFDIYGNPVDNSKKVVPTDITPQQVYEKYIKAIGGADKVKKIKDVSTKATLSVQGTNLEMVEYVKAPNKTYRRATMQGNEAYLMVFDGNRGFESQMGQKQETTGKELEDQKIETYLNYEAAYKELGLKLKMLELSKVEGQDAYKVEVTLPSGTKLVQYFDKNSGLKLREEKTSDTPQGQGTEVISFFDYKDVNGVKFPHKVKMENPGFSMEFNIQSIELNKGVKDDLFKIQ
jgi:zinc protease